MLRNVFNSSVLEDCLKYSLSYIYVCQLERCPEIHCFFYFGISVVIFLLSVLLGVRTKNPRKKSKNMS